MAHIRKTLFFGSLVALFSLQSTLAANKTWFFPAKNSSMLMVTSNITIELYDKDMKNEVGNITLIKNNQTKITSNPDVCTCDKDMKCDECELKINFPDKSIKLDLTFRYNKTRIQSYWEWAKLTIEGTINGTTVSPDSNGKMNLYPKGQGFTQNSIYDISCERDYTSCAPLALSWTCDDQKFSSNGTQENPIKITFPGLQLQPFFKNEDDPNVNNVTAAKFGYVWSCDPLISIPIWTGLLIGLGLLLGFMWAIGMIASVNTPDKFDDPKGKQISVPQQD